MYHGNEATNCKMNIHISWIEMWLWITARMLCSEYSTVNVPNSLSSEDEIQLHRIRLFPHSTLTYTFWYYLVRRYHGSFWRHFTSNYSLYSTSTWIRCVIKRIIIRSNSLSAHYKMLINFNRIQCNSMH